MKAQPTLLVSTLALTSVVHLLCCLLPLLSVVVSVGGLVAFVDWLEPLRPPLLALQLGVVVYAFYKAYFSRHAGHRTELLVFWLSLLITVGSVAYPYFSHAQAQAEPQPTGQFGMKIMKQMQRQHQGF
ncbi:MAG: hypothetical protein MUC97_10905 [Bernardetiaceae bacterium]|jgi:hypothetical protein|nr:hypothetical protein [Bernardetiaceae bacterium]